MLRRLCSVLVLLLGVGPGCSPAWAIDKDYLQGLQAEKAERVLASFHAPLYYVVGDKDANALASITQKNHYASRPYQYATLLFVDEKEAREYVQHLQKTTPVLLKTKATNLNRILLHMYKTRHEAPSTQRDQPDMVIVDTLLNSGALVYTFVDDEQRPYVHEVKGKKFIPAFMQNEAANAFQAKLRAVHKTKYVRQGVDFKAHLRQVESYLASATPVLTFGADAEANMALAGE